MPTLLASLPAMPLRLDSGPPTPGFLSACAPYLRGDQGPFSVLVTMLPTVMLLPRSSRNHRVSEWCLCEAPHTPFPFLAALPNRCHLPCSVPRSLPPSTEHSTRRQLSLSRPGRRCLYRFLLNNKSQIASQASLAADASVFTLRHLRGPPGCGCRCFLFICCSSHSV